jgi:hypothetical protein
MSDEPRTLEEMVARYGRALAIIDEETGELKVAGMAAHSVDIDGKPKRGTPKPKNNGWEAEEEEDDEDVFEKSLTSDNEKMVVAYLNGLDDDEFDAKYPEDGEEEAAAELKWIFDVVGAFARRALTNRRGKKKRKEVSDDTEIKGRGPCWDGYEQRGMKPGKNGNMVPNCVPVEEKSECCPDEAETKAAKKRLKDPKGGLTAAGRAHFKRTEGANLKPGVKGPANTPEKMRRKGSFLTRFFTNPSGPMKDEKGRPTRLALSAAAWGEPVPQNASDAAALAAKGRRMLERYENAKKKKKDALEGLGEKALGPTIGGSSGPDATRDHDGDGVINDGTQDEKPAPPKKGPTNKKPRVRRETYKMPPKPPTFKPGYLLGEGDDLNMYDGEPPKNKPYLREHTDGSLYEFRPNMPPRKVSVGKNEKI